MAYSSSIIYTSTHEPNLYSGSGTADLIWYDEAQEVKVKLLQLLYPSKEMRLKKHRQHAKEAMKELWSRPFR